MQYNRKQKSLLPIDIKKFNVINTGATFKQYDINTSILELELVADGEPVHLTDEKVYVTVKSSNRLSTQLLSKYSSQSLDEKDNYKVLLKAEKSNTRDISNLINVYISPLALENSGEMIAEVMIIDLIKEERITSQSFTFKIDPSITPNKLGDSAYKIVEDMDGTYITDSEDVQLLVAEIIPNFKLSFTGERVNEILEKANNFDVEANNSRLGLLENEDTKIKTKISKLEEKDSNILSEISNLKSVNNEIKRDVENLKSADETIKIDILNLKEVDKRVSQDLDLIKVKNSEFEREISEIKTNNEESNRNINLEINQLKSKNESVKSDIDLIRRENESINNRLTSNDELTNDINLKINSLISENQNIKSKIDINKNNIDVAKSNISLLQNSTQTLRTDVDRLGEKLTSQESIILEIQREVETLKSYVDLLQNKVPVWKDFKGESFKVENSFYGKSRDLSIKGKTLFNIFKWKGEFNGSFARGIETSFFKPSTKYTIFHNTKSLGLKDYIVFASELLTNQYELKDSNVFTTKDSIPQNSYFHAYNIGEDSNIPLEKFNQIKVLILEGDWTDKLVPSYFEGIKSLGEQEGNKISILSHGKNLCPINTFNAERERMVITKVPLVLKPNTNYFVSSSHQIACLLSNIYVDNIDHHDTLYSTVVSNGKGLEIGTSLGGEAQFNSSNFKYCYVTTWIHIPAKTIIKDIMLEEGTRKSIFQPYKSYKKDILLSELGFDEGFRGIDDSIYDELDDLRNISIKRVGKYTFTGNENWFLGTQSQGWGEFDDSLVFYSHPFTKSSINSKFICNLLPYVNVVNENIVGICNHIWGSEPHPVIRVKKSDLSQQNIEGFKTWLKEKGITIYYELAKQIETPLNNDLNFGTLDDVTYVSLENNIKSELSCQCKVSLASSKA